MSYRTWHDYGYGICTADLSKESIMKLYKHYNEEEDCELGEKIINDINSNNGINSFISCFDFDGDMYIMYSAGYPWHMKENDKSMTEQKVKDIINSYMKEIIGIDDFDDNIIGYQEVENGG